MATKNKMGKLCKDKMVDELLESIKKHPDFIVTNYMGTSVADMEALRKGLRKISSSYVVVKNSILKVVFDKMQVGKDISELDGGIGLSLSGDDVLVTCKEIVAFSRNHDKFIIRGAYIDGKPVGCDRVKQLAAIPSKEVLLTQLVTGMKSPITGFVNTLSAVLRKFVNVVDAIKKQKETK